MKSILFTLVFLSGFSYAGTYVYECNTNDSSSDSIYFQIKTGNIFRTGSVSWNEFSLSFDSTQSRAYAKADEFKKNREFSCVSRLEVYRNTDSRDDSPYLNTRHCLGVEMFDGDQSAKYLRITQSGSSSYEETDDETYREVTYDCKKI